MLFRRTLMGPLASAVSKGKVRLLFGARQTGKTALFTHLVRGQKSKIYDLQDGAVRRRFEEEPARFGREVRALPKDRRVVVVDEIQKVPALLDEVQSLIDSQPRAREFFVTGSSARKLRSRAANLLPGRAHVYHLGPVTRWEQRIARRLDLLAEPVLAPPAPGLPGGRMGSRKAPPLFPAQDIERTLLYGSLPGVMQESDETAALTLTSYVETYLEEELRREALVRDIGSFISFLRLAAIESGRIVNLAALSRESGVPQSTLRTYYDLLEDTFIGHRMEAYGRTGRKRVLSTPRFFLFDAGVRTAAASISFERGSVANAGGSLLEHWVGIELIHRARYRGRGFKVSFWRTATGAEVDFVWEGPGEDLPIEVKWTARPTPSDARHIESFLDCYPERAKRGLLVCRAEAREQLTDRVLAIPWEEL